jgi:hypothetical protein
VQTTERLADRAFRARRGRERFVVYMEAYTYWTRAAPWSVLSKSGLLSERERLPVVSLLYVLRPRGYRPQGGQFRLAVGGEPTQQVWFREVLLWEQEPQPWWETCPGLMVLYPLCRHRRSSRSALVHAAGAIAAAVPDVVVRADLLTTLGLFGRLVHPEIDVWQLIGREQMRESSLYQEILEEGRAEGRLETQRAYILEVLQTRFGSQAATTCSASLAGISNSVRLERLFRRALVCAGPEEFQHDLAQNEPARRRRRRT